MPKHFSFTYLIYAYQCKTDKRIKIATELSFETMFDDKKIDRLSGYSCNFNLRDTEYEIAHLQDIIAFEACRQIGEYGIVNGPLVSDIIKDGAAMQLMYKVQASNKDRFPDRFDASAWYRHTGSGYLFRKYLVGDIDAFLSSQLTNVFTQIERHNTRPHDLSVRNH